MIQLIRALDPTPRGLTSVQRYEKSRKLVEAVLGSLSQCIATAKVPIPAPVTEMSDTGRKMLLRHGRPASYGDATEANISLAEQMWKGHADLCRPSSDEWLTRLMARLSR
jgi:hypothetical protein